MGTNTINQQITYRDRRTHKLDKKVKADNLKINQQQTAFLYMSKLTEGFHKEIKIKDYMNIAKGII